MMTNAQVALIAAATSRPNGSMYDIRAIAGEFVKILESMEEKDPSTSVTLY